MGGLAGVGGVGWTGPAMPGLLLTRFDLGPRLIAVDTGTSESLPLESSRSGSVFSDRFDPTVGWYLPALAPAGDPDPGFAFAATVAGVDASSGDPFDTASVTMTVQVSEPPDLAAARATAPTVTYRPIPMDGLSVSWSLVGKDPLGADQTLTIPMTVVVADPGALTLTGSLVGASVVVAYENLVSSGTASLVATSSYRAWREWQPPIRWFPGGGFPGRLPEASLVAAPSLEVRQLLPVATLDGPQREIPLREVPIRRVPIDDPDPTPPEPVWTASVDPRSDTLALGTRYGHDVYRSRFTITAASSTRPIIDINDLVSFSSTRSEFRELTSLGDVPTRYPSLRRLYLGQVTGTVVIVPQSYGIIRGRSGTAAACRAVVDDSTTTTSGCRFDFTFALAPVVDPVELAQLAHDLGAIPEAGGRALTLTLPTGMDPRTPSSFPTFAGATAHIADGSGPQSVVMTMSVGDTAQIPAVCNVNTLLSQLASTTTQLSGELMVRLDDVYPTPIGTSLVLSLNETSGTDDVSLTSATDGSPSVTVTNAGPVPLLVAAVAAVTPGGPVVAGVDQVLSGGASTVVALPEVSVPTVVRRDLALTNPMPRSQIFDYIDLAVTTVTQVQHPLSYNAAFDFAAAGVRQLDVITTLTAYPGVAVVALTLTPTHRVDSVHALVPLDVVVSGLAASVQVTVTPVAGSPRTVTLTTDFVDTPILVITSASVAA